MKERSRLPNNSNRLLWLYLGFAFQALVSLGIGVYAGIWIDKWIKPGFPLMVWVLPLAIIISLIVKVIKDTNRGSKK
jgi:Na+/glutamate symporter